MNKLTNVLFIHKLKRERNYYSKYMGKDFLYSFTIGTSKDDGKIPLSHLTIKFNDIELDIYNEYNGFNTGNIEFKLNDYANIQIEDLNKFEVKYKYNNNDMDCYIILNVLYNHCILGEKKKIELLDMKRNHIEKFNQ